MAAGTIVRLCSQPPMSPIQAVRAIVQVGVLKAMLSRLTPRQRGTLFLLAAAVLWSLTGLFTRIVHADPWTMQFWRAGTGAVFLVLVVVVESRGRTFHALVNLGRSGLLAVPFSAVSMVCYMTALSLTSVAEVMIVYATQPFVNAGMAWLLLREPLGRRTALAALAALAGVAITVLGGDAGQAGSNRLLGDVAAFAMVFGFSAIFLMARSARPEAIMPVNAWAATLSAMLCLPLAHPFALAWHNLLLLTALGCLTLGLGLTLLSYGSKLLPAGESALLTLLDVPLSPLWVWLAIGEVPGIHALLGGAIVMGAVLWQVGGSRQAAPPQITIA